MTISKQLLSGGTDGRQIKIVPIVTPGTLIHTANLTAKDEIWLWATNSDGSDQKLTIEWGGVLSPDDLIEMTIPFEDGPHLVVPGLLLTNSLIVRAFAALTNVVLISGYVNRHT